MIGTTAALIIPALIQKYRGEITLHHATLVLKFCERHFMYSIVDADYSHLLSFSTLSCVSSLAVAPMCDLWRPRRPATSRRTSRISLSQQYSEEAPQGLGFSPEGVGVPENEDPNYHDSPDHYPDDNHHQDTQIQNQPSSPPIPGNDEGYPGDLTLTADDTPLEFERRKHTPPLQNRGRIILSLALLIQVRALPD